MTDLISRQTAIDAVQQHREGVLGGYEYDEGVAFVYAAAHNHIIDVIKHLPSAQQWISVTERLPENDNDVLVTDGTDCAVAYWRTDAQAWDDSMHGWCDLYGLEVVAWMELPKPWEGEQNERSD